jgi:CheY-like chemotaxis protein
MVKPHIVVTVKSENTQWRYWFLIFSNSNITKKSTLMKFTFEPSKDHSNSSKETIAANAQNIYSISSLKVIVAEDHNANSVYIVKLLQKLGIAPEVAKDGFEVLERVRCAPCDVILMDCHMPQVDGLEATRTIRHWEKEGKLHNKHPIYIMAVTANILDSGKDECFQAGMDQFTSKPLLKNKLKADLINIWGRQALPLSGETMALEWHKNIHKIFIRLGSLRTDIGDKDTAELIQDWIDATPLRLTQLEETIENQSTEEMYRLAHSYKSICQIYGMTLMASLCAKLESQSLPSQQAESHLIVKQLKELFNAVKPLLKSQMH